MALAVGISILQGTNLSTWAAYIFASLFLFKICTYVQRAYFHPYAKYPGPPLAAISNLWYAYHWFTGRYPWAVEAAFKRYGDVIRVAPNELAFFKVEAQNDILMAGSTSKSKPFIKTNLQSWMKKHEGIAAERDPEKHRVIRKQLVPAFNPRALKEQEPALHTRMDTFIEKLALSGNNPKGINMPEWFDWLSFDIAGDMAYGHDFKNVHDERSNTFLWAFRQIGFIGTMHQVFSKWPLARPLVFFFLPPKLAIIMPTIYLENNKIVRDRVERRHNLPYPDYLSQLVTTDDVPEHDYIVAQANHLILGGFDPDTNLFTSMIHFLLVHPDKLEKLKREIRTKFNAYEDITGDSTQSLHWLKACIEESLRVHSNGAFGLPRVSPGAFVDGHWIPEGYQVQTSIFATSHSERYFFDPRSFRPERWLPVDHADYDKVFNKDDLASFKPFSMGPRGCIGQNMGYMQTRILFAKMIWKLDWEHVNAGEVDWERDVRLYAIWTKPKVMVRFRAIEREGEAKPNSENHLPLNID